jgi:hypothetical protein
LLGAKIEVLASAPSSPQEGQIYYNSTDQTVYVRLSGSWLDLGQSGGGISDSDYGDITVTASGTVWTIDPDSVTYSKIQNIAADNVLLGNTSGAGSAISELSATQVRSLLNIEDGADVTDAANVNAAGAVMNSDTSTAEMSFVLDEDNMASDSNTKVPTQQSVKAYVDTEIASALASEMSYKGGYNAATNSPDLDSSPIATAIGDTYTVTNAGTFFTTPVQVGDVIICEAENATTEGEWTIVNKNIPDIADASESDKGIIEIATQGEVTTGTDDTRAITPLKLKTHLGETGSLNSTLRYTEQIGNGALTNITVTHNIGRQFVTAQVFETSSPYAQVECDIECDSANVTSFTFNSAPSSNEYTVVIVG